jgi:hypothetical protein
MIYGKNTEKPVSVAADAAYIEGCLVSFICC